MQGIARDLALRFVHGEAWDDRRGHGPSKRFSDIIDGVIPPPIKRGRRDSVWPDYEIEEVLRAELRGASVDERRALVRELVARRARAAPRRP